MAVVAVVDVARAREEARGSQMEAKANPRVKVKAKARIQVQRGRAKARIPKGRARAKARAQAKESPKGMMIMEVAKEKGSLHPEDGTIMVVKAKAKAKANRKGDTNHPGVVGTAGMIGHIPATTKVVKGREKAEVTGEPLQRRPPL